jgi:hypothetical protein
MLPHAVCSKAPTNPTNGSYIDCSTPAAQGVSCEATCEPGFTAETVTATCGVDGEWSYSNNNTCTFGELRACHIQGGVLECVTA